MGFPLTKLRIANELALQNCCTCGTPFGIESQLDTNLRQNHKTFYCPLGHAQSYTYETEVQKAREETERIRQQLLREQSALATERQLRAATETKMNQLKKRVGNGVCPCCKRSFSNLHRHMGSKHPDFKKPEAIKIG